MFIDDKLKAELQNLFAELTSEVNILMVSQELECQYCKETRQLLTELSEVSDKINLEVKDFVNDKEYVEKYGADKIPATILLDKDMNDYGIRFFGIPSGYEFSSLIESIKLLGTGNTGFSEESIKKIQEIDKPVHLQVFVTPTCPHCPGAVVIAHRMAYINKNIVADMVEATEFPQLSQRYSVRGVPRTVVNENEFIEGAAPETMVLDKIFESLGKEN